MDNSSSQSSDRITTEELARFTSLSNTEFHRALEIELKASRRHELLVVHLMREADRREIWAVMGYNSLMDYCVRCFKMSETDFYRKRSILETIREIPDIETKILDGKLNTTNVAQAASFLKREAKILNRPITVSEKRDVLSRLEGKSFRDVQREFAVPQSEPVQTPAEPLKPHSAGKMQRTYTSTPELEILIQKAKEAFAPLLSPDADHAELLIKVFTLALERAEPLPRRGQGARQRIMGAKVQRPVRPRISETLRLAVSRRDNFACAYVNPETGRRCESKAHLKIHHVIPLDRGGGNGIENLRLVCREHGERAKDVSSEPKEYFLSGDSRQSGRPVSRF